jgi:hypothetical protein
MSQYKFSSLPRVTIIHLKRFRVLSATTVGKIQDTVTAPVKLNLGLLLVLVCLCACTHVDTLRHVASLCDRETRLPLECAPLTAPTSPSTTGVDDDENDPMLQRALAESRAESERYRSEDEELKAAIAQSLQESLTTACEDTDVAQQTADSETIQTHSLPIPHSLKSLDDMPPNYSLRSVVAHLGSGAASGHYVALVAPSKDHSSWRKFNDSVVSKVCVCVYVCVCRSIQCWCFRPGLLVYHSTDQPYAYDRRADL